VNRIDEPEGQGGERSRAAEPADEIERASENVLEGWPDAGPNASDDESDVEDEADLDAEPVETDDEPEELEADGIAETVAATEIAEPEAEPEIDDSEVAERLETSSEHAPGELVVPPGYAVLEGQAEGRRRAVGIVVSRFNGDVTGRLLESALDELGARGVGPDSITVMPVPGAFELPIAAMALAKTRRFACIVALGCVIRGDTPHFDYVASEAASGLQLAAIETGVPVAFGVLTLDRPDQAEPRYSKGAEAVGTALEMADLFANLRAAAAR
jgi:6,7-dimethyl-8-ribityllumazine synthase